MGIDTVTVAYRFARASSVQLQEEISAAYAGPDDPAAKVARIEYQLTLGHEAYQQRRYTDALAAYRLAEGMLYSLVAPRFDPAVNLGDDVRLTVDPNLFRAFAETALTSVRIGPAPGAPAGTRPAAAPPAPPRLA